MKEVYLHYLYRTGQLGKEHYTTDGKRITIVDFGQLNTDAGPDFLEAKLEMDNVVWAGAVEFHLNASDWYRHGHHNDRAYDNVIGHFVLKNDRQVVLKNGLAIPTVEVEKKVDLQGYDRYLQLMEGATWVPCQNNIAEVERSFIEGELEMLAEKRLWRKALTIVASIEANNGDRRKGWVLAVARTFGGQVNALPFECLADQFQWNWLAKLNFDSFRIEALILGLAGRLPEKSTEDYVIALCTEFNYLKKFLSIKEALPATSWKFSRMRPTNFPDIRLAQFVAFLIQSNQFRYFFEADWHINDFCEQHIAPNHPYWTTHYRLGKQTQMKKVALSKAQLMRIAINAVIPFIYAIGLMEGNNTYKQKAISFLHALPSEQNTVINRWKQIGVSAFSALQSQALLELKKERCNRKKCLFCMIGNRLLSK